MDSEVSQFLQDAKRFILKNSQLADIAPLQLYASGIIFAPQKSLIKRNFERELPDLLSRGPIVEENWSPELQTLEGHSRSVRSVAFSRDDRLLVSGSSDQTIKLWDPATSTLKHTLKSHSGWVGSVTFSQDGRLLASGSSDKTIMLWDPTTGTLKHTLEGHSSWVLSVAFSRDGRLLASGSVNHTIKLWDSTTGTLKHTLQGHSSSVQSVAFSGDGRLLASGSSDKTIKLWDPATGALKHTITADSMITHIEFSKHLLQLNTNVGSFDIDVFYESLQSDPSKKVAEVSLAGRWVTIQGQRELWLPPNYQPISSAAKDSTIALGCINGGVAIITFSIM